MAMHTHVDNLSAQSPSVWASTDDVPNEDL